MNKFKVISDFTPQGDQPKAIQNLKNGLDYQIPFKAKVCDENDYKWSEQAMDLHREQVL